MIIITYFFINLFNMQKQKWKLLIFFYFLMKRFLYIKYEYFMISVNFLKRKIQNKGFFNLFDSFLFAEHISFLFLSYNLN
jgi:hypothetical protein